MAPKSKQAERNASKRAAKKTVEEEPEVQVKGDLVGMLKTYAMESVLATIAPKLPSILKEEPGAAKAEAPTKAPEGGDEQTNDEQPTEADGPTVGPTTDGPGPGPTTTASNPGSCCNIVKFSSAEGINANFPTFVGRYSKIDTDSQGHGVFKKTDGDLYIHYSEDLDHKFEAWILSEAIGDETAQVINDNPRDCVDSEAQTWAWLNDDHWEYDSTARVECDDIISNCCDKVVVASTGGVSNSFPEYLGEFSKTMVKGKPSYKKGDLYLYYLNDVANHIQGWTVGKSMSHLGSMASFVQTGCPNEAGSSWEYISSNQWTTDPSLTVTCA